MASLLLGMRLRSEDQIKTLEKPTIKEQRLILISSIWKKLRSSLDLEARISLVEESDQFCLAPKKEDCGEKRNQGWVPSCVGRVDAGGHYYI